MEHVQQLASIMLTLAGKLTTLSSSTGHSRCCEQSEFLNLRSAQLTPPPCVFNLVVFSRLAAGRQLTAGCRK